jgi:hypothetical protein
MLELTNFKRVPKLISKLHILAPDLKITSLDCLTIGVNLVPKGGTNTTMLFSSEGAKNQRAPSEDYTFFHYC